MGIIDEIEGDGDGAWHAALASLEWQFDLGVVDPVGDVAVNRYDLAAETARPLATAQAAAAPPAQGRPPAPASSASAGLGGTATIAADPAGAAAMAAEAATAAATAAAEGASTLEALHAALAAFDHCDLKRGARHTVFADGTRSARVLVLGEAPGREEDIEGRPFVGAAGKLLDRMFAAIGLSRGSTDPATALYITNVIPWRPPANRDPEPGEIAMMRPFVARHITLANPEVIVAMGNIPLLALTRARGILKARGVWTEAFGRPLLPMAHPAYLLRNPAAKRDAWADLLTLKARLTAGANASGGRHGTD